MTYPPPDRWLDDGDEIDCGATTIAVRATLGHTRGHTPPKRGPRVRVALDECIRMCEGDMRRKFIGD